jgi:hypothetical protein
MRLLMVVPLALPLALVLEPPPAQRSWMLDDFETADHTSAHGLEWIGLGDDLMGNASRIVLERVPGGAHGSGHALRLQGSVGDKAPAFTGAWVPLEGAARPVDLSAFDAIRFYARGEGTFQVGLRQGPAATATNFMASFTAGSEWKAVEISFDSLAPAGPGSTGAVWRPQDVHWLGISSAPGARGAFQLEVDDVALASRRPGDQPSPVAQAGPARTVRVSAASPPANGAWTELAQDPAGDGKTPSLPDAVSVAVRVGEAGGYVWFRIRLREAAPEPWLGLNLALDTDGDPANGSAWWGVNTGFHFDRLVSVWVFKIGRGYQGLAGIAGAAAVADGDFMAEGTDVQFAVEGEPSAFLVGVPRSALGTGPAPARFVAAVGSAFMHNDDLPDAGAVLLAR